MSICWNNIWYISIYSSKIVYKYTYLFSIDWFTIFWCRFTGQSCYHRNFKCEIYWSRRSEYKNGDQCWDLFRSVYTYTLILNIFCKLFATKRLWKNHLQIDVKSRQDFSLTTLRFLNPNHSLEFLIDGPVSGIKVNPAFGRLTDSGQIDLQVESIRSYLSKMSNEKPNESHHMFKVCIFLIILISLFQWELFSFFLIGGFI